MMPIRQRQNAIVQYTMYLLPLAAAIGAALKLGRVPIWVALSFLPGVALHLKFKLGWNYYLGELPRPVSSRLSGEKSRKIQRTLVRLEDETITGVRLGATLGSIVLASRGLLGLAVLIVCYGLVTAEFLNQSRMRRWRDEIVDEAAEEAEDRLIRRRRQKNGRRTSFKHIRR